MRARARALVRDRFCAIEWWVESVQLNGGWREILQQLVGNSPYFFSIGVPCAPRKWKLPASRCAADDISGRLWRRHRRWQRQLEWAPATATSGASRSGRDPSQAGPTAPPDMGQTTPRRRRAGRRRAQRARQSPIPRQSGARRPARRGPAAGAAPGWQWEKRSNRWRRGTLSCCSRPKILRRS